MLLSFRKSEPLYSYWEYAKRIVPPVHQVCFCPEILKIRQTLPMIYDYHHIFIKSDWDKGVFASPFLRIQMWDMVGEFLSFQWVLCVKSFKKDETDKAQNKRGNFLNFFSEWHTCSIFLPCLEYSRTPLQLTRVPQPPYGPLWQHCRGSLNRPEGKKMSGLNLMRKDLLISKIDVI